MRIGRDGCRAHVFGDSLWVVQYLDLHGVVVTLFSAVRGAVVVLVPNLIPAVASERHRGKRNDCPVLAHKPVARGDDTGCVEYLEHLRDLRKQSTLRWFGRTLLALMDAVVGIEGNPQVFRREDYQPSADEVLDESVGRGVSQCIRVGGIRSDRCSVVGQSVCPPFLCGLRHTEYADYFRSGGCWVSLRLRMHRANRSFYT